MKYENQTREHLVALINKRGESGKAALGYILYKEERERLERIYNKTRLEQGIINLEYEDAIGNFYLYMWNGAYFEKLQKPESLGSWIGKIFYRFLLHDWQTIKKLERAISVSYEERFDYEPSEQLRLSWYKTALSLVLIYQTQKPERRYAFYRILLKRCLRQDKKKLPPTELTDLDVAFLMQIKDARFRQWAKRVGDDVKRMVLTMKPEQLVCQLTADSLALADQICNGGNDTIIDWLYQLIDQTEEQLPMCDMIRHFREGLRKGTVKHYRPVPKICVDSVPAAMFEDSMEYMCHIEKTNAIAPDETMPEQKRAPRKKAEPKQTPEKRGFMSVLEQMLGI